MTTTEVQPCENCGRTATGDDDMYQRARPGSKAHSGGWRFERLCEGCHHDGVTATDGGPWGSPPPSRPPKPRRGRR